MPANQRTLGHDPVGRIVAELSDDGFVCAKELSGSAATRSYHARAAALARSFAGWAVAPADQPNLSRLVFRFDLFWEPLPVWLLRRRGGSGFPLEAAVRIASGLCDALQQVVADGADEPEIHAASIIVSESQPPYCRLLLWPRRPDARPSDYLDSTPEVLSCTPPEDLCGVPVSDRRTYAAAAILRLLFLAAAPVGDSREIVETLVLEGNSAALPQPPGTPAGLGNALREQWAALSSLVQTSTARHERARSVALAELEDACLAIRKRLNYWELVNELCAQHRYADARDVCEYAIETNPTDDLWRPAFKRRLGSIYLNHVHDYKSAARAFERYLATERQDANLTDIHESLGDALTGLRLLPAALRSYLEAAEVNPLDLSLLLKIARTQRELGDSSAAIATLRRAADAHRTDVRALKTSAEIYLETSQPLAAQSSAAESLARLRARPQPAAPSEIADCQALAAAALFDRGEFESARQLAAEALRQSSQCYRALNVFGRYYAQSAMVSQAMRSFLASLKVCPDQPQIERWLQEALLRRAPHTDRASED